MASFYEKTPDSYDQAKQLAELRQWRSLTQPRFTDRSRNGVFRKQAVHLEKSGLETWKTAFAPDESFFAWSCGNQYVVLLPLTVNANLGLGIKRDTDKGPVQRVLDCGSYVFSVAFGSATSNHVHEARSNDWTLHKFNKDLIVATGLSNGVIRIWEVISGKLLLKLMDHTDVVRDIMFAPNGSLHLASASHDSTVKVWHLKDDGNMYKTLRGHTDMNSCCWSPDSKKLVAVGRSRIGFIWSMLTYKVLCKLEGHLNSISCCDFSPDGTLIVTSSYDTQVIVWDSQTGHMLRNFMHQFPRPSPIFASGENGTHVRAVSFSKDGSYIATVADDGFVRFWDLTDDDCDPSEIATVNKALCCKYSPSGRILAVGTKSGVVNMLLAPMKVRSLRFLCQGTVKRLLSLDEDNVYKQFYETLPQHFMNYILS